MNRFALALLAASIGNAANAAAISGPVINPANGNSYYLLEQANWLVSQAEAESLGGNLVTINDAAENSWVFDTFAAFGGSPRALWIGLTDETVEGSFVWVSGEALTYDNFGPGEPNDGLGSGTEDYVFMLAEPSMFSMLLPGEWNDAPNVDIIYGVVEVAVPEPTTLTLTAFGLLAMCCRRRKRA